MTKNEPWVRYVPTKNVHGDTRTAGNAVYASAAKDALTEPPDEPHYRVTVELVEPEERWWWWDVREGTWEAGTDAAPAVGLWADYSNNLEISGYHVTVYGTYGDDINQKRDTLLEAARKAGRYEHDS